MVRGCAGPGRLTSSAAVVFLQRRWQFGRSEKRTDLQKLATSGLNLGWFVFGRWLLKTPPPQKKGSLNEVYVLEETKKNRSYSRHIKGPGGSEILEALT